MCWKSVHGDWIQEADVFTQSNIHGITRYANDSGHANYVVELNFCMTGTAPGHGGEVKFILTDAHEGDANLGERWRIDFVYGPSICRVTALSLVLNATS